MAPMRTRKRSSVVPEPYARKPLPSSKTRELLTFMDLPLEIRQMIYSLVLPQDSPINHNMLEAYTSLATFQERASLPALANVNEQTRYEAFHPYIRLNFIELGGFEQNTYTKCQGYILFHGLDFDFAHNVCYACVTLGDGGRVTRWRYAGDTACLFAPTFTQMQSLRLSLKGVDLTIPRRKDLFFSLCQDIAHAAKGHHLKHFTILLTDDNVYCRLSYGDVNRRTEGKISDLVD